MFVIISNGVQPCGTFSDKENAKKVLAELRTEQPDAEFAVYEKTDLDKPVEENPPA